MKDSYPGSGETIQITAHLQDYGAAQPVVGIDFSVEDLVTLPLDSISDISAQDVDLGQKTPKPQKNEQSLPHHKTLADYILSKQVGGDHYKTGIQPWDVFMDWRLDPWLCNVIKYVQRHHKKNGSEDLQKALHYLEFAIENYDKIKKAYYERD